MFQYILAPVDGSRLSHSVLPYATQVAKAMGLPIVLLHSVDPGVFHAAELEQQPPGFVLGDVTTGYSEEFRTAYQAVEAPARVEQRRYLDQIIASETAIAEA